MAFASTANAGITIPAGDWTLDIGGVVNAYYTSTSFSGDDATAGERGNGKTVNNITTGLLPNYLSVSGKSRQNDLDIAFTISINPGASTTQAGIQSANQDTPTGKPKPPGPAHPVKAWGRTAGTPWAV